jgi:peptidoglycan hydrolase CwlO-like protein
MATSKQLQKKIRRADAEIKRVQLEIRKLKVQIKKGQQQQKRLESGIENVTKRLTGVREEIFKAGPRRG